MAAHRLGAACNLVGRFAFHAQGSQVAANLRLGGFPAHDDVHGLFCLL